MAFKIPPKLFGSNAQKKKQCLIAKRMVWLAYLKKISKQILSERRISLQNEVALRKPSRNQWFAVVHKNWVLYNSQTFQYPIKLQNPVMLWIPDNRIVGSSTTTEVISNTFVLWHRLFYCMTAVSTDIQGIPLQKLRIEIF